MENEKQSTAVRRKNNFIGGIKLAVGTVLSSYTEKRSEGVVSAVLCAAAAALRLCMPVLYTLTALLLSGVKIYGDIYPMGLAFVSACGRNLPFAYLGAVAGSILYGENILITVSSYTAIIMVRILFGMLKVDGADIKEKADGIESPADILHFFDFYGKLRTKMSVSAAAALAVGVYSVIAADFSFDSLASLILICAITPVLTYFYAGAMGADDFGPAPLYREAGMAALTVSLTFSLRGLTFLSLDITAVAALSVTLIVTLRRGWLRGCILGLFLGLTLPVALVPAYAAAALPAGFICKRSPYLAVFFAAMTSLSYITYAGGYAVSMRYLPELLFVFVAISVAIATGFLRVKQSASESLLSSSRDADLFMSKRRDYMTRELLGSEAQAFSALSDMFYRLSDKLRSPSAYDIRQVCEAACEAYCKKCRQRGSCWLSSAGEGESAVGILSTVLRDNGVVTDIDIPDFFLDRCEHPAALVKRVNESYSDMLVRLAGNDKTEVLAFDYESMSAVFGDIITQRDGEYDYNEEISKKLSARLHREAIGVGHVRVYGERLKTVYLSNLSESGMRTGAGELKNIVGRCCGGAFSRPVYDVRGSEVSATMTSRPIISTEYDRVQCIKDESRANGDIAIGFECRGDRFCALICDGMGSGHEAALTSGICALFIEKMMTAGNSAAVTLKMLNCMLRAKKSECSSTVDLLELDLLTGRAKFIKSGAAVSYIVRGADIYKIHSKTVPVGIIRTLDAEQTSVDVVAGDLIILMSDGVAQDEEDCGWLYSVLSELRYNECKKIAGDILRASKKHNHKSDDATVCVIRVTPSPEDDIN